MTLDTSFLEALEKHKLVRAGDHILLGVSGGADSVALLLLFYDVMLKKEIALSVFHLNHQFRGLEADSDQRFVEALCAQLELPCYAFSEDISQFALDSGQSFETAARERRYELLDGVLKARGCTKIALAHHLNDQVETFFQRLTRGAGIDGLTGMQWQRDAVFIRPLLGITRVEIEIYLTEKGQQYCTDGTNTDTQYMRNRVRHELIPYLETHFNASIVQRIGQTMSHLQQDKDYLDQVTQDFLKVKLKIEKNSFFVALEDFDTLHVAVANRVVRQLFKLAKGSLIGLETSHVEEIVALVYNRRQGTKKIHQNVQFSIDRESLVVEVSGVHGSAHAYAYSLEVDKPLEILEASIKSTLRRVSRQDLTNCQNPSVIYFSAEHIELPLTVRSRLPGDRIKIKGLSGHKSVKDIFRELKIPENQREICPIVEDRNGLVWVHGGVLAESCYISAQTQDIFQLTFDKL